MTNVRLSQYAGHPNLPERFAEFRGSDGFSERPGVKAERWLRRQSFQLPSPRKLGVTLLPGAVPSNGMDTAHGSARYGHSVMSTNGKRTGECDRSVHKYRTLLPAA